MYDKEFSLIAPAAVGEPAGAIQRAFASVPGRSALDVAGGTGRWSALNAAIWLRTFNDAWQERRWRRLETLLAVDVEFALRGAGRRIAGRPDVIAMLRRRYARTTILEYAATELRTRAFGGIGIVGFRWTLELEEASAISRHCGRTEIGLRLHEAPWKALWISEFRS